MQSKAADPDLLAPERLALNRTACTAAFTPAGTLLRANTRFLRSLGYQLQDVVGAPHAQFTLAQDAAAPLPWGETTAPACTCEFVLRRRDGTPIWLHGAYQPVTGPAGEVAEVVLLAIDVTTERQQRADSHAIVHSIDAAAAVMQYSPAGIILAANARALALCGAGEADLLGRHHADFLPGDAVADGISADFWAGLQDGGMRQLAYRFRHGDGAMRWRRSSFVPVHDELNRIQRVMEYATDVTDDKLRRADFQWQITAIHKSHAVITFDMDGTILFANSRFLDEMGYTLPEIEGRHHRILVEPSYAHGSEYAALWRNLSKGRYQEGQFRRFGKNGREVWLQASYNPVFDTSGMPVKVVQFATFVTHDKLRQADQQGQIAAIHKSQCIAAFGLDGTVLDANENFLDLVGYRLGEVRGRHHRMFVEPGFAASDAYAEFWASLARGEFQSGEYRRMGKDGRDIWLRATYNPILDMNGQPFKVVKYATDVTADKLLQADFTGQIAAINKSQAVITFAMDGTIQDANANFLRTVGYALHEVRGRNHRMFLDPMDAVSDEYRDFWHTLRAGTFLAGLFKRIGKDGREVWIQASYNPILDLNNRPFKVVKYATDVTANVALAQAYEDAKRQAQHDAATALPNRVRLTSFLNDLLNSSTPRVAVFYIDVDHFKTINDSFGHQTGDLVLGIVADRLRRGLDHGQLVARVGGAEFVIAAPGITEDQIELLCQRLLDVMKEPIRHDQGELTATLSIGIAVTPTDAHTTDDILHCADVALRRSKQNGRGGFSLYSAEMSDRIHGYQALADDMRRSIVAGDFYLEYQPRFDACTHRVNSVEALVRWAHPERGTISPADFIPAAERSGLILPLGAWIMRAACAMAASLDGVGVSVNVSPIQFRDSDVVALVQSTLAETGLPGHLLEIELTEGVLLEDAGRARQTMAALKALGVRLAIDDFGTGYSSLSYLSNFPFDVLKIDRQFINELEDDIKGRPIVQAILSLARALGLSVTAEGVETDHQLQSLRDDKCNEIQGFLLARPMAAGRLLELLAGETEAARALATAAG